MNREIRKLSQSFRCAFRGVALCVREERNFRIHLCAAAYVAVFAVTARLTAVQGAVLCLCFGLMLGAELFNTALERLCDRGALGYDNLVRDAKDLAAAAVLVCALFSAAIAVLFFAQPEALANILGFFRARLWALGALVVSVPVSVGFIFAFHRF